MIEIDGVKHESLGRAAVINGLLEVTLRKSIARNQFKDKPFNCGGHKIECLDVSTRCEDSGEDISYCDLPDQEETIDNIWRLTKVKIGRSNLGVLLDIINPRVRKMVVNTYGASRYTVLYALDDPAGVIRDVLELHKLVESTHQ